MSKVAPLAAARAETARLHRRCLASSRGSASPEHKLGNVITARAWAQQLRGEKFGRAGCFNATIRYVAPMGYPLNSAEHDPSVERRGLLLSVVGALGMAALGIGFFFVTDSVAVLLDGLFSLIGFAVSLIAIRVAALVQQPDDECFHFGYAAYEPMLNLIKGLLIAFVTVFAMISAIGIVLNGGREIQGSIVVVYALVAAVGCLVIAAVQRRAARVTGSPLLAVDSKNWFIDGAISGAVAVAFFLVVLLGDGPLAAFKPYADPAVVILLFGWEYGQERIQVAQSVPITFQ